ncbi:MAG: hypothetical protein VB102_03645 [Paludibacter sp.]|nr:hypothetical protein [Paludibacter sp.]
MRYRYPIVFIIILVIYFLFPNSNLSVDSLGYGCSVKYGVDLFSAHHLLYNYFNHLIYNSIKTIFPLLDALRFMQFTNALFAVLCLIVLRRLILKQTNDNAKANVWTFFVGASFGVMRFAVEAETYIMPIFFSLISSSFYFKFLRDKKTINIFLSAIFVSLACLFHQIHLFWGIGLFIGLLMARKIKPLLVFSATTLLVPFIYILVMIFYQKIDFSAGNLVRFLGDYYYSNNANTDFGLINFIVTPITFFRTFFQVHGIVIDVLRLIPAFYLIIPVVLCFIILFIVKATKSIDFRKAKYKDYPFEFTHLFIFLLQFSFAFYSHGNSEFMVMLPFLIPIFVPVFIEFDLKAIKYLGFAMLIWNFFFAIFPNNCFDYQNNRALLTIIKDNPDKVFILKERNIVVNQYYYEIGTEEYDRLIDNQNKEAINKLSKEEKVIYTDVLTKHVPFNRANVTSPSDDNNLIFKRHISKIDSDLGEYFVDEVSLRKNILN